MTNRSAFLDMIAHSEMGDKLITETDNGYNVLVGSTPSNPLIFSDYSTHPNILNRQFDSTAAGRYQITHPTFLDYCQEVGEIDFGPSAQDMIAEWLLEKSHAMVDVDAGNFEDAVQACSGRWASLPGSTAGQHVNAMSDLKDVFIAAGGVVAT